MIQLQTNLTSSDITRVVLALLTRRPILLRDWLIWFVIVGAVIVFMRGVPGTVRDTALMVVSAGMGAVGSVAFSICITLLRMKHALKRSDGVLGTHEYELRDDGLFEKTSANETLTKWKSVKGVLRAGQFFVVELPQGAFHIIPIRSFTTANEQLDFYSEVSARVQSAL